MSSDLKIEAERRFLIYARSDNPSVIVHATANRVERFYSRCIACNRHRFDLTPETRDDALKGRIDLHFCDPCKEQVKQWKALHPNSPAADAAAANPGFNLVGIVGGRVNIGKMNVAAPVVHPGILCIGADGKPMPVDPATLHLFAALPKMPIPQPANPLPAPGTYTVVDNELIKQDKLS